MLVFEQSSIEGLRLERENQGTVTILSFFDQAGRVLRRWQIPDQGWMISVTAFGAESATLMMTTEWLSWLDQRFPELPFFGFLFYDAVNDKTYPPEYAGRVAVNAEDSMAQTLADYKTSVMFDDELVGQVLADLEVRGLAENTVVIISADHGEEFNENGDGVKGHAINIGTPS